MSGASGRAPIAGSTPDANGAAEDQPRPRASSHDPIDQPAARDGAGRLKVLALVGHAYEGRVRVRRDGTIDDEGLDAVLTDESRHALSLAHGERVTAVHLGGEDVIREAMSFGCVGIMLPPAPTPSQAATMVANVVRDYGPFDLVVGPRVTTFGEGDGTIAALAGILDWPCLHGVTAIQRDGAALRMNYRSMFGTYVLRVPRPCAVTVGKVPLRHPAAADIARAYERSILAPDVAVPEPRTIRLHISSATRHDFEPENVDANTLVRRLRSRALLSEDP